MAIADIAAATRPELEFVIAGTGSLGERLAEQSQSMPNLTVLRNISAHDAQCLRATTEVGTLPDEGRPRLHRDLLRGGAWSMRRSASRMLASAIGGVPEATPDDRFLVAQDTPAERSG